MVVTAFVRHWQERPAPMDSTLARIRWWVGLVLVAIVALIALQNIEEATVTILVWTFQPPLIMVILLSFLAGLILGWLYRPFRRPGYQSGQ
jgi:uncharacterized integral membrane protein